MNEADNIPDNNCVVVGDFNSHSERWGYNETDRRGEEVEDWEIDTNLQLINQEDDPPHLLLKTLDDHINTRSSIGHQRPVRQNNQDSSQSAWRK